MILFAAATPPPITPTLAKAVSVAVPTFAAATFKFRDPKEIPKPLIKLALKELMAPAKAGSARDKQLVA